MALFITVILDVVSAGLMLKPGVSIVEKLVVHFTIGVGAYIRLDVREDMFPARISDIFHSNIHEPTHFHARLSVRFTYTAVKQ